MKRLLWLFKAIGVFCPRFRLFSELTVLCLLPCPEYTCPVCSSSTHKDCDVLHQKISHTEDILGDIKLHCFLSPLICSQICLNILSPKILSSRKRKTVINTEWNPLKTFEMVLCVTTSWFRSNYGLIWQDYWSKEIISFFYEENDFYLWNMEILVLKI